MSNATKTLMRIAWVIALLLVISGSLLPASSSAMQVIGYLQINDKLLHFLGYAVLGALPALHETRRALAVLSATLIAVGIALEYGQLFSPGRSFELLDMAADAAGVACGVIIGLLVRISARTA